MTGCRTDSGSYRLAGISAAVLLMAMLLATGSLWAQEEEEQTLGDLETRETQSMREATYKELAKAQEAAEEEDYSEAIKVLDKLTKDDDLNSYELSQIYNLYAFIYYSQDRLPQAIQAYEKLLQQPDLPEALETGTVFNLSQLYFSTENWRKAIEYVERWMTYDPEPKSQNYELISQAYYQLGEYRNALVPARRVVELQRQSGQKVKEQSLLMVRVLHFELGETDEVIKVLHELIKLYPKEQYWMQLASLYGEKDDQQRQLGTLELAYVLGYLDQENEVMSLAGLLLQNDLPYRAGNVLQKGIDDGVIESSLNNWRLLSQAWTLAKEDEKAIPALTRAANMASDGKVDLVLAQSYMNLNRWDEAVAAAQKALSKGGLDRPDQAHVLLGQALFNLERFDEARQAFVRAQADSRSRQLASQWINYIEREQDRLAQLAEALEQ